MSGEKNNTSNKDEIRKCLEGLFVALSKKDIKQMMSYYADDAIVFDVKPPFQSKGAIAWKHVWEASLPFFPDVFKIEIRDLVIHADGNIGFAHYLFKLVGEEKNHPAMQTWMRASTGYKLIQGKWKVIHEHASLPFSPQNNQVVFSLEV
ncbi:MAG: nuclear transport factor 2 family protein [Bacteroidia bacterium]|nr:nuclear transport factor 2 family protein [Bacteroidia bacterium]